ncbi:MAG: hypothetical protein HQ541_05755 [Mariniphaga sp.]|nr:hypothetical protein [Mariniphaga sp.]
MDELKNIAPKLSKIRKENPFKIPNNYFDDFNARLDEKIKQEYQIKKSNPVIRILKPVIGIAASLAIIFMLVNWPFGKSEINQTANIESGLPEYNIENAIIGIMEEMDDISLFAIFESEIEDEPFSDDELIGYLSANLSDYDIYIESAE